MDDKDICRFSLKGFSCTQTLDPQGFSTKGSYDLAMNNLMVASRGVSDYNMLSNHPSIENIELVGNKDISDFGVGKASNTDILNLFK